MKSATCPCPAGAGTSRWRWVYPVMLALMIFSASGRSQMAGPPIAVSDKLVHFLVFGLLGTLVCRAPGLRRWWGAVLVVSFYGIADEFRQSFTPGRFVEFEDWVADTTGAALAVTLYTFWGWYRRLLEMPLRWPGRLGRKARAGGVASGATSVSVAR